MDHKPVYVIRQFLAGRRRRKPRRFCLLRIYSQISVISGLTRCRGKYEIESVQIQKLKSPDVSSLLKSYCSHGVEEVNVLQNSG